MKITPEKLEEEFAAARDAWPFIEAVEAAHQLPRFMLYAVGSRETNLTDEIGDGGHGHGIFQLDDRSHTIPDPFPVELQAETAAGMLRGLLDHYSGQRTPAIAAYNAGAGAVDKALSRGQEPDTVTAGHDYAVDVLARLAYLQGRFPEPTPSEEDDMPRPDQPMCIRRNPNGPGSYELTADGGIRNHDGAPFPDGMPAYVALASDHGTYSYPADDGQGGKAMNYLGLPEEDRRGERHFVSFDWA